MVKNNQLAMHTRKPTKVHNVTKNSHYRSFWVDTSRFGSISIDLSDTVTNTDQFDSNAVDIDQTNRSVDLPNASRESGAEGRPTRAPEYIGGRS